MTKLQIGDVVALKSGGPKMTVSALDGDDDCDCIWFNNHDLNSESFPAASLEKIDIKT